MSPQFTNKKYATNLLKSLGGYPDYSIFDLYVKVSKEVYALKLSKYNVDNDLDYTGEYRDYMYSIIDLYKQTLGGLVPDEELDDVDSIIEGLHTCNITLLEILLERRKN